MSEIATLSHETVQGVELFNVAGEVDASNATELSERVLGAVSNQARAVVLDLSNTTYIDSSGISLIFGVADGVRNRRQELRLVVVPGSFASEVLAAVSVEQSIPIDPVLGQALDALR